MVSRVHDAVVVCSSPTGHEPYTMALGHEAMALLRTERHGSPKAGRTACLEARDGIDGDPRQACGKGR